MLHCQEKNRSTIQLHNSDIKETDKYMDKTRLSESRRWIREELDRSQRFWLENGMDKVNGGIYTCLDREGKI